jgi:dCTP deaminase
MFILGKTLERVALPIIEGRQALAARSRIEGKSSFARCGLLVHFTAPTVHAGFEGTLTLEMINLGTARIALFSGMPICQLILEIVSGDPRPNPSQFQGQATPAGV